MNDELPNWVIRGMFICHGSFWVLLAVAAVVMLRRQYPRVYGLSVIIGCVCAVAFAGWMLQLFWDAGNSWPRSGPTVMDVSMISLGSWGITLGTFGFLVALVAGRRPPRSEDD